MCFGGPSIPAAPVIPPAPPAASPATMANPQVAMTAANSRARAAAAGAYANTVGTSPQGLNQPQATTKATLLGGA